MTAWEPAPGVLALPSGRLVRGRALRRPQPTGAAPDFGLYLLGHEPDPQPWESRWVRWPDFRLPVDPAEAQAALADAWRRSVEQRVEVACDGGRGRTGTALACLAASTACRRRRRWPPCAPATTPAPWKTPWQRRFVARFAPPGRV